MRIAAMLEAYATECATRMDLAYTIRVEDPPVRSREYYLAIDIDQFGRRLATIKIGKWFPKLNRERKRLVVAHELGHLIAWDYTETLCLAIPDDSQMRRVVDRAEEEFCDRLAAAIAPLLPRWGET